MENEYFSFNINYEIKFKPTNKGLKILQEDLKRYNQDNKLKFEEVYKIDDNLYYRLPMWEFARLFSKEFYMGNNELPCETDILINKKDLQ